MKLEQFICILVLSAAAIFHVGCGSANPPSGPQLILNGDDRNSRNPTGSAPSQPQNTVMDLGTAELLVSESFVNVIDNEIHLDNTVGIKQVKKTFVYVPKETGDLFSYIARVNTVCKTNNSEKPVVTLYLVKENTAPPIELKSPLKIQMGSPVEILFVAETDGSCSKFDFALNFIFAR